MRNNFVYPGQPLVVALAVMKVFNSFKDAMVRTEYGWPEALSNVHVPGAGCAVYNALDLLKKISDGLSPEEAVILSRQIWERYVGNQGWQDKIQPGLEAQVPIEEEFVDVAKKWEW